MADKPQTLALPLLVTRSLVIFPGNQQLIEAGRAFSINAINYAHDSTDSLILVTTQKNISAEEPRVDEIYNVGTLCRIISISERDNHLRIRVEVLERMKIDNIKENPGRFYEAEGTVYKLPPVDDITNASIIKAVSKTLESVSNIVSMMPKNVANLIARTESATILCYALAGFLNAPAEHKQEMLESENIETLMKHVVILLTGEKQKDEIEHDIAESVRESTEKSQKEYYLREKLKAIKKELGENSEDNNDPDSILEKIEANPYPEFVKKKVKTELKKFDMMPQGSLEAALIQSYLDVLLNVPWYEKTVDDEDLKHVEQILDEDHYGLENPKKRIIEYLAVKKLTGNLKSPILCFYGPPGTGKTSLGKSIARALGRKFFKASLGGISDEAEIRGHRRTYVGSMPGRIIQGMRKVGVTNPVFLLDEVDKLAVSETQK